MVFLQVSPNVHWEKPILNFLLLPAWRQDDKKRHDSSSHPVILHVHLSNMLCWQSIAISAASWVIFFINAFKIGIYSYKKIYPLKKMRPFKKRLE
jgi:hypothetical protein